MGTYINLMINQTSIDFGKNNYFNKHFWLFPPNSIKTIEYQYADEIIEKKNGFSTTLDEVKFRMDNLGYSLEETKGKYKKQLDSWNRVNNLTLPFEFLLDVISKIDLNIVTDGYMDKAESFMGGFREYLKIAIEQDNYFQFMNFSDKMKEFNTYYSLEDFIIEILDIYILIRLFCEKNENLNYNLEWQFLDVIESGWVSYQDIEEFDKKDFIINHNKLYGRLQTKAINENKKYYYEENFDDWLIGKGISVKREYKKILVNGNIQSKYRTLPVYIRNIIHHPENLNNTFSDAELNQSITQMLNILR